jgi:RNA-directed DNA polymerase
MANRYRELQSPKHLLKAWKRLSKRKHSRGFDEQTIEDFKQHLPEEIQKLSDEIRTGRFRFTPLQGVLVSKPDGSKRPLKVPAVRDRVVLKAIYLLIAKNFKRYDLPCSYGYIDGKSVSDAIRKVRQLAEQGNTWVLEGDISKFFDSVDQELLMQRFLRQVRIKSLEPIIRDALRIEVGNLDSFRPEEREMFPLAESGIPQGGVLSPMLANYYLHPFDRNMTKAQFHLVRYADDFVVMCPDRGSAEAAYRLARKILNIELKLKLHELGPAESKTRITPYSKGFNFLGLHFQGGQVMPSGKAKERFRQKICEILSPSAGKNLLQALTSLRNTTNGWGHAYESYDSLEACIELDSYVRQEVSTYLRMNGLLARGQTIGLRQRKFLGVPSLAGHHARFVASSHPNSKSAA